MKNLGDINWYEVQVNAFTLIRVEFSVSKLQEMSDRGNDTPASGDALAAWTRSLAKSRGWGKVLLTTFLFDPQE